MNLYGEILRGAGITAVYLAIFACSEIWRRWRQPAVEVTRKFVHLACGIVALSLSWFVESPLTVAILCGGFMLAMGASRRLNLLPSVHSVTRRSGGDFYFPLAILSTFTVAHYTSQPAFYTISLLVLALADSAAALIGIRYGRNRFLVQQERKSIEGCGLFFLTTFTIVHIGLSLLTDISAAGAVLSALYVALLVTCVESLSLSGADNLFIPLAVIAILLKIITRTEAEMLLQNGLVLLDFGLVALMLRSCKNLSASAVLGLALLTYGTHALVGLDWAYVLFFSMALYRLSGFNVPESNGSYRIRPTFHMSLPAIGWLLLTNYLALEAVTVFFVPFAITVIAVVHLLLEVALREALPGSPWTEWLRFESRLNGKTQPSWPAVALRGMILTLVLGGFHSFLDQRAQWQFELPAIFIGELLVLIPAFRLLTLRRGLIRRIEYCSLWAVLVSSALCLVAWHYYYGGYYESHYGGIYL